MRATKTVVFAALVVALAVNVELFKDPVNPGMPTNNADTGLDHSSDSECNFTPDWQCKNTHNWYLCAADEQCVIINGLAI